MSRYNEIGKTATRVTRTANEESCKLHDTVVARRAAGVITLNSGGWRTPTTKRRLNQFSQQFGCGYAVYQSKGEWFVNLPNDGGTVPFYDGITFKSKQY